MLLGGLVADRPILPRTERYTEQSTYTLTWTHTHTQQCRPACHQAPCLSVLHCHLVGAEFGLVQTRRPKYI